MKSGESRCRANFRRIKAQKVQEYFVYFKLFATLLREGTHREAAGAHTAQSRQKFAGRCQRRMNQRFPQSSDTPMAGI